MLMVSMRVSMQVSMPDVAAEAKYFFETVYRNVPSKMPRKKRANSIATRPDG
jgi:hypothetical protein